MATNTYVALKSTTLTSATGIVTFDLAGISGYTDLRIVVSARGTTTAYCAPSIQFNSDTSSSGTNYSWTAMFGDGYSPISYRVSNQYLISGEQIPRSNDTAGLFGLVTFDIMNYSNSTTHKTVLVRNSSLGSTCVPLAAVGLWRAASPTPITYITIISGTPNFEVGSTFTVYGITASDNTYSTYATGGTVTADTGYVYHTFTSSGTFTPSTNLTCDYLVVAGGGGGAPSNAWYAGGGGGAGGYRTGTGFSATAATGYSVTVGAGGTGSGNYTTGSVTSGSDSTFSTVTSAGGGKGSGGHAGIATAGGSGGGGGDASAAGGAGNTPSTTPSQGNNGGTGSNYSAGGGGGAGSVGANSATINNGGAGGSGSTWVNGTTYAGGGGGGGNSTGGSGGSGGGGLGGNNAAQQIGAAGTANTGGGGGGGGDWGSGAGGSGVVIIRYPK